MPRIAARHRRLAFLLALAAPSASFAAWMPGILVGQARVAGPSGDVTFAPTNLPVDTRCSSKDIYIMKAANNAKMGLSVLLAAQLSGKTVRIYMDDANPCDAVSGRPAFTDILLDN